MLSQDQLIRYLRLSVQVNDPDSEEQITDRAYLSMTDDDLLLYLSVALSRDFPDTPSLDYVEPSMVFPLVLLAKRELYLALATSRVSDVDLGADNNNYIKRSQRFSHYTALADQAKADYDDWLENGGGSVSEDGAGANTLTSFDVLLSNRYHTRRYYEKGKAPAPVLYVDDVTASSVSIHWKNRVRKFAWCNVYCSKSPIVDEHQEGSKIVDVNERVKHIKDARQVTLTVEGLDALSEYYVAIEVVDRSGLIGYSQVQFDTLGLDEESGDSDE